MQASVTIDQNQLVQLITFLYEIGHPRIYQSYSECGKKILQFTNPEEILLHLNRGIDENAFSEHLCIYYPQTKGPLITEKIRLKPKYCNGHKFRYRIGGWGAFNLYLDFTHFQESGIECWISCNTQKRAERWFDTIRRLKNPSRWDWKEVKSIGRKLRRFVKKFES